MLCLCLAFRPEAGRDPVAGGCALGGPSAEVEGRGSAEAVVGWMGFIASICFFYFGPTASHPPRSPTRGRPPLPRRVEGRQEYRRAIRGPERPPDGARLHEVGGVGPLRPAAAARQATAERQTGSCAPLREAPGGGRPAASAPSLFFSSSLGGRRMPHCGPGPRSAARSSAR